ncbi:MAG: hypothetical protein A2W33_07725 [Chloroflexi bacterium RBG_16_52_11]|nr:MAG: hypothetical protein A2W33_07725 [Chloroflexi bacterium RBG_16_52_11]
MITEKANLIANNILKNYKSIAVWSALFLFFYLIGLLIPQGFDCVEYFSKGLIHPVWTPWTNTIVRVINWPLIVAITLWSLVFRTYKYHKSPLAVALVILSLPTLWVIFMGNLDGLVLAGLILLPWGVPLVLMKPQLSAFALLAEKSHLIAGGVWLLISFIGWGFWPINLLMVFRPEWKIEWVQDISLFPWGLLIALPLLWLSRGDEDLGSG